SRWASGSRFTATDGSHNPCHSLRRFLMLPYAQHHPASIMHSPVGIAVSLQIARELYPPPLTIGLRTTAMLWTAMPETAIDKDRHAGWAKQDISSAPQSGDWGTVNLVSHTSAVQQAANFEFRCCVPRTLRLHSRPRLRTTRPRAA